MDRLDRPLFDLLTVNARLPVVKRGQAFGCARSTVHSRLKALEDFDTISVSKPQSAHSINAMALIPIESKNEPNVVRALRKRHEIAKLYSISGRYHLCGMRETKTTHELDAVIDPVRALEGVVAAFSTIPLSTKPDRPD